MVASLLWQIDTRNNMKLTEISRSGNFAVECDCYTPPLTSQYVQSQNYILNVTINRYGDGRFIHKYSLTDEQLIETDFRFPYKEDEIRSCSGYVLSKNEKYLIILGGRNEVDDELFDGIILFDIDENRLIDCELKCPFKGEMEAISMDNYENSELLVSGYIRHLWRSPKFKNMITFPICLLNLISQRICIEYIHIVARRGLEHWKINFDDIRNSIVVD